MKATRIVITDHVVPPSSQPSIRDHTTSSIKPEAPDAAKSVTTPSVAGCRRAGGREALRIVAASMATSQNSIRWNALIPIRNGIIVPAAPIARLTRIATVNQNRNS